MSKQQKIQFEAFVKKNMERAAKKVENDILKTRTNFEKTWSDTVIHTMSFRNNVKKDKLKKPQIPRTTTYHFKPLREIEKERLEKLRKDVKENPQIPFDEMKPKPREKRQYIHIIYIPTGGQNKRY